MGDYKGAIASLEEQLTVLRDDWDVTAGETVGTVRREIQRLRGKM